MSGENMPGGRKLRALVVCALTAAVLAAPVSSAHSALLRDVLLVGNSQSGSVSFIDGRTYQNLGSFNAIPDLQQRLDEMDPIPRSRCSHPDRERRERMRWAGIGDAYVGPPLGIRPSQDRYRGFPPHLEHAPPPHCNQQETRQCRWHAPQMGAGRADRERYSADS
jgi:hypothetical protein